nr:unnamed protein product [Digitaria exilis]
MNIVRGVADLLRKAPPPPAPGGDARSGTADAGSSFPAGGHDDAPTPRVVFSDSTEERVLSVLWKKYCNALDKINLSLKLIG